MASINLIKNMLTNIISNIDAGTSNLTEDECIEVIEYIKHITDKDVFISKYEAYTMLKTSPSTFNRLIAQGKIPKGVKQSGFKELMWKRKDIEDYLTTKSKCK